MRRADTIHYSQSWEDPDTVIGGLHLTSDDTVLSIAAAGDNTFALLLQDPRKIVAIDRDPAQLNLVELKIRAIQRLEYGEFLQFMGVRESDTRLKTYSWLRLFLSPRARLFWDSRPTDIAEGIIHAGKFEHYFRIFRSRVLPMIHTGKTVTELFRPRSLADRMKFYHERWNTGRWRALFRVFFSRFVLGRYGRDRSTFRYVTGQDVANELLRRSTRGFTEVPPADNYFLRYILTGRYDVPEKAHPYLHRSSFETLKQGAGRVTLVCEDLSSYLATVPPGAFSAFNLSDVFEYMSSDAATTTMYRLIRAARAGARIGFWTLFVPRPIPAELRNQVHEVNGTLFRRCKTFFYSGFHVWRTTGSHTLIPAG